MEIKILKISMLEKSDKWLD